MGNKFIYTLALIGYTKNNPLYILKEKWNLLVIPRKWLLIGIDASEYYTPDFSYSTKIETFILYIIVMLVLIVFFSMRNVKLYRNWDLSEKINRVMTRYSSVFLGVIAAIMFIMIFGFTGKTSYQYTSGNNYYVRNVTFYTDNEELTVNELKSEFRYYSFSILDKAEVKDNMKKTFIFRISMGILVGEIVAYGHRSKREVVLEDIYKI